MLFYLISLGEGILSRGIVFIVTVGAAEGVQTREDRLVWKIISDGVDGARHLLQHGLGRHVPGLLRQEAVALFPVSFVDHAAFIFPIRFSLNYTKLYIFFGALSSSITDHVHALELSRSSFPLC